MAISIKSNFKVSCDLPIDSRQIVESASQLASLPLAYEGLTVFAKTENCEYIFKKDENDVLTWQKVDLEALTDEEITELVEEVFGETEE